MIKEKIKGRLQQLTGHQHNEIVSRGNNAITSALSIFPEGSTILIPEEGGWIHYKKAPVQLGLKIQEIKCDDAKINLTDLKDKLKTTKCAAFLYQNPGGYFAEQPMVEIYELCTKNNCLVIMDVSGGIGTPLCNGTYADIMVGSFGEWKLVEAKVGGFISAKSELMWEKVKTKVEIFNDENSLHTIHRQLLQLPQRIAYLQTLRDKIMKDLDGFNILYPKDTGFVVVVEYNTTEKKQEIIGYCTKNKHHYTECPRYIRINKPAISIELKREQQ